jgi:bidirectional [NiFe] hydrogenase diaphorase subunit
MADIVRITIDDKEIDALAGEVLLEVCLDNDIYIPNLCHIKDNDTPSASCRLCFIELEGIGSPVPACTVKIDEGMKIYTDTQKVRRLQRAAFKLLLSTHLVDCPNCPANKVCDVRRIASFLGVSLTATDFEKKLKHDHIIKIHPLIKYYPNRCVLCARCVHACEKQGHSILSFAQRGIDTVITIYGQEENQICESCRACIAVCPVKALLLT